MGRTKNFVVNNMSAMELASNYTRNSMPNSLFTQVHDLEEDLDGLLLPELVL